MAKSVVTPERFANGMTFDEYVKYAASPENLAREAFAAYYPDGGSIGAARKDNSAVLRERYARWRGWRKPAGWSSESSTATARRSWARGVPIPPPTRTATTTSCWNS